MRVEKQVEDVRWRRKWREKVEDDNEIEKESARGGGVEEDNVGKIEDVEDRGVPKSIIVIGIVMMVS